jgi:isopentenyl-diphosphate delta-isomerase
MTEERLILVDPDDNILGYETKAKCHQGKGILHRAFSLFIFNRDKQLLVQKRSALKPLWPLFWSNSVCSHPRQDEMDIEAAHRRLKEEIGIDAPLQFLFKFQYQASFKDIGSEHELCSVYIGKTAASIQANPEEIAQWRWLDLEELDREIRARPERYSPWFKLEWQRIKADFMKEVEAL